MKESNKGVRELVKKKDKKKTWMVMKKAFHWARKPKICKW